MGDKFIGCSVMAALWVRIKISVKQKTSADIIHKVAYYFNIRLIIFFCSSHAVFRKGIRKFLGLPDPDPLARCTDPDPPLIKQK